MLGLPASGKSTKAKELVTEYGNTVRLNKDLLRTMLHFDKFTGYNEGHTKDASRKLADWFLTNGVNVIVDDTNLNPNTVQSWKDFARIHDAKIEYHDIDTPVQECISRDNVREKKVGANVIKKMALQYKGYLKGEKVIICDIDGTIADITHRLQYGKGETKDWGKFFSLIHLDAVRKDIIDKVAERARENDARVIIVSARPETYRAETEKWLDDAFAGMTFGKGREMLIMREANDKRPDTEVKSDIYDKYLKDLDIQCVYDDRPSVIRMWREKGLTVIDVGNQIEF